MLRSLPQEWDEIKVKEVKEALRKARKWKSPGIDKVPNFWLNTFDFIHENMTNCLSRAITSPETNRQWFKQGITYLLPKSNETNIPKNCRPITCLLTMYKILISIVTERTYNLLDAYNILAFEQKGCKKGSYGCKDQLLFNKMFCWKTVGSAIGTLVLHELTIEKSSTVSHTHGYQKCFKCIKYLQHYKFLDN